MTEELQRIHTELERQRLEIQEASLGIIDLTQRMGEINHEYIRTNGRVDTLEGDLYRIEKMVQKEVQANTKSINSIHKKLDGHIESDTQLKQRLLFKANQLLVTALLGLLAFVGAAIFNKVLNGG